MIGATQRGRSPWAPLAWMAALLLALAPTLSRLAAESPEDVALCTASGLRYVPAPGPVGEQAPAHDDDCAYCPLLAGANVSPAPIVFLPLAMPALPAPASHAMAAPAARGRPASWPRGPPARA